MNIPLTADSRTTKDKFFSYVEAKGLGASLLIGCKFNSNAGKAEALERIRKALTAEAAAKKAAPPPLPRPRPPPWLPPPRPPPLPPQPPPLPPPPRPPEDDEEHDGPDEAGPFDFAGFRSTLPTMRKDSNEDTGDTMMTPMNPLIGNFDPNVLPGSALLCIAHSSLKAQSMFSLPSTLLTYTKPGHNLSVRDAESALKRMAKERRIVKNVGQFHVRPNSDATPNYVLVGDSRIPCVGLYKITPGRGVKMLERWHSDDKYDVKKMYQLASKHECNNVMVLACKS